MAIPTKDFFPRQLVSGLQEHLSRLADLKHRKDQSARVADKKLAYLSDLEKTDPANLYMQPSHFSEAGEAFAEIHGLDVEIIRELRPLKHASAP